MRNLVIKTIRYVAFVVLILFLFIYRQPVLSAALLEDNIEFFVDPVYHYNGKISSGAVLGYMGNNAYFYVEKSWFDSLTPDSRLSTLSSVTKLSKEFDDNIYPRLTDFFGSEWKPGIDNDDRITIFILQLRSNVGGYFSSTDEQFKTQAQNSNEREIIYLNSEYINSEKAKSFLAHELQHMITYYQKEKKRGFVEDVWLNEARSEYASTLLGYDDSYVGSNLERRVNNFKNNPSDSLTEWQNETIDYSSVNLFFQYLVDQYGQKIVKGMINVNTAGVESINQAFLTLGIKETFQEVFTHWTVTNYLNDCNVSSGVYCYKNDLLTGNKLKLMPSVIYSLPAGSQNFVVVQDLSRDWSSRSVKFYSGASLVSVDPNIFKLKFEKSQTANFSVPYILTDKNGKSLVGFLDFQSNQGELYIEEWGSKFTSLVIIPSAQSKQSDFNLPSLLYAYSYAASLVDEVPEWYAVLDFSESVKTGLPQPKYPDGALIRQKGGMKVYIVKGGKYKRWIQSPEIFNMYGHLKWSDIREVIKEEIDYYEESFFVRAENSNKVFQITSDGQRRWLDMSGESFVSSGRSFAAVYLINIKELNIYKDGVSIRQ